MLLVMAAAGLAVAVIAWVGIDSACRQRNWLAWSMSTALFGVFGLLAWFFRRNLVEVSHNRWDQAAGCGLLSPRLRCSSSRSSSSPWTSKP